MAIGARASQVTWLFVRETLLLLVTGIGIGMVAALSFTRLLTTFLGGVDPRDPVTFALVTLMLAGVAVAAALMPSLGAARIDPVAALRGD
jgi:putative ABC transport system permease protein